MPWSILWFGKYSGKTLPQIMFVDPDWFFWACEDGAFRNKGARLKEEAEEIKRKSTSIRIPQNSSEKLIATYTFSDKGFADLEIASKGDLIHGGLYLTYPLRVIDFSQPREPIPGERLYYDKQGYRIFLKNVKFILFGDRSYRMTRRRCEEFFDNDANFEHH